MRFILPILASLTLAACGESFSGTYADPSGIQKYKFNSNGKVTISSIGIEQTANFKKDGNTLRLTGDGNVTMVFDIKDNNTIVTGNGLLKLQKISD